MKIVKIVVAVVVVLVVACALFCTFTKTGRQKFCGFMVSSSNVASAVEKQGFKDVEIESKHIFFVTWRGCSRGDDAAFDVYATNAFGKKVNVIACAGWPFKGVTVRTK